VTHFRQTFRHVNENSKVFVNEGFRHRHYLILDCSLQFERALATNSSQGTCSFSFNGLALRLAQSFSRLVIKFLSFVNIQIFVIVILTKILNFRHRQNAEFSSSSR